MQDRDDKEQEVLHLTDVQQDAVIGWMLKDREFLIKCRSSLKPTHFNTDAKNGELFTMIADFAGKFDRPPTVSELEAEVNVKQPTYKAFEERKEKIRLCMAATNQIDLIPLTHRMTDWLRLILLRRTIAEAAAIYNQKRYSDARQFIETQIKALKEADFEQESRIKFENTEEFLQSRTEEHASCCTMGHPDFDEMMKEHASIADASSNWEDIGTLTKGCLIPGDVTILSGPSNAGKTTSVITVIKYNILMGKDVLLITHEQKEDDIKYKIIQSMMKMTGEELSFPKTDVMKRKLWALENMLERQLTYVPWIKPGRMFVEEVVDHIDLLQQKRMAQKGKGYDLLVVDYPGLLKSKIYLQSRNASLYDEKGHIYRQFQQSCRVHKFHGLFPAQTNREAYKVNRGDSKRQLDQADIGDSWQIARDADNIIMIGRGPKDSAGRTIRFHVTKSRMGPTGGTFASRTDFGRGVTHGPNLACCTFRPGESVSDDQIAARLGSYERAAESGKHLDQSSFVTEMPDSRITELKQLTDQTPSGSQSS